MLRAIIGYEPYIVYPCVGHYQLWAVADTYANYVMRKTY